MMQELVTQIDLRASATVEREKEQEDVEAVVDKRIMNGCEGGEEDENVPATTEGPARPENKYTGSATPGAITIPQHHYDRKPMLDPAPLCTTMGTDSTVVTSLHLDLGNEANTDSIVSVGHNVTMQAELTKLLGGIKSYKHSFASVNAAQHKSYFLGDSSSDSD